MKSHIFFLLNLLPLLVFPQSDFDKVLRGSEILLSGLTIFKVARSDPKDSKNIESVCVKNRLLQKITFRITRNSNDLNELVKELVVQKNGKECIFELPKGIYTYEIFLASNETYKKGEYKFEDATTFIVKDP